MFHLKSKSIILVMKKAIYFILYTNKIFIKIAKEKIS